MTLRTGEDTLIWRRRLWIALYGGIVLDEALDLSADRILNGCMKNNTPSFCAVPYRCSICASFVILQTSTHRVRSKLFVACQHVAFSLPFAAILLNCAPSREMHNYCTPHIVKENFEYFLVHRCNCILLSQVYCVWQVVKTPTFILNNPVVASCMNVATAVMFPVYRAFNTRFWRNLD